MQDPNETVKLRHIKLAVLNVNNMVCAMGFFLINITVQGISVFMVSMKCRIQGSSNHVQPTILFDLGWTNTKAQLYSVVCIIKTTRILTS